MIWFCDINALKLIGYLFGSMIMFGLLGMVDENMTKDSMYVAIMLYFVLTILLVIIGLI